MSAPSADERRDAMLRFFAEKLLAKMPASALNAGRACYDMSDFGTA